MPLQAKKAREKKLPKSSRSVLLNKPEITENVYATSADSTGVFMHNQSNAGFFSKFFTAKLDPQPHALSLMGFSTTAKLLRIISVT